MSITDRYSLNRVSNLEVLLRNQREKFRMLRARVRDLRFVPIDPAGAYTAITFKSFDGGMFSMHFDPFEFDIVEVADSNGNSKLKFAAPGGDLRGTEELRRIIADLDRDPVIRRFLGILGRESLSDVSEILTDHGTLMELGEFACMFDKVMEASADDRTIILRDGFLRTKKIKAELVGVLRGRLEERKSHVKVVGVAKKSRIMFLLKAAIICERIFPEDQIGYIEVPLDLENMAYTWSGHGMLDEGRPAPLDYAFGRLYIARLARNSNMLVTVEIPQGPAGDRPMYTDGEIREIMGHLARDSMHSYPVRGYPQTIMRAHEFAASAGIPSSILQDRIMGKMVAEYNDEALAEYVRDSTLLGEVVEKRIFGGTS